MKVLAVAQVTVLDVSVNDIVSLANVLADSEVDLNTFSPFEKVPPEYEDISRKSWSRLTKSTVPVCAV